MGGNANKAAEQLKIVLWLMSLRKYFTFLHLSGWNWGYKSFGRKVVVWLFEIRMNRLTTAMKFVKLNGFLISTQRTNSNQNQCHDSCQMNFCQQDSCQSSCFVEPVDKQEFCHPRSCWNPRNTEACQNPRHHKKDTKRSKSIFCQCDQCKCQRKKSWLGWFF